MASESYSVESLDGRTRVGVGEGIREEITGEITVGIGGGVGGGVGAETVGVGASGVAAGESPQANGNAPTATKRLVATKERGEIGKVINATYKGYASQDDAGFRPVAASMHEHRVPRLYRSYLRAGRRSSSRSRRITVSSSPSSRWVGFTASSSGSP